MPPQKNGQIYFARNCTTISFEGKATFVDIGMPGIYYIFLLRSWNMRIRELFFGELSRELGQEMLKIKCQMKYCFEDQSILVSSTE